MSVGMMGRRMTGRHRRRGQIVYNIYIYILSYKFNFIPKNSIPDKSHKIHDIAKLLSKPQCCCCNNNNELNAQFRLQIKTSGASLPCNQLFGEMKRMGYHGREECPL